MIRVEIVNRVRILAAERGVSLAQFERECGFSKNSVVKWDRNMPGGDKLLKAAKYFGVSVDYLLGNSDSPLPPSEEELPEFYFHFLKGASELDLSQRDMELLLSIARRFKKEDGDAGQ